MKKIIITLMVLTAAVSASAQEAFKHLGAGLEIGTAGAGINVALPVVDNHLTVKIGYNFPNITYTASQSLDISEINASIREMNAELASIGASEQISTTFSDKMNVDVPLRANLGSFKALVEFYPFAKSSFHITAGAFIGSSDFISADIFTDEKFWSDYKSVTQEIKSLNGKYAGTDGFDPVDIQEVKATINGETWAVREKDGRGNLNAALAVAKARPYVGLGFGRSVPNHRVTFKFDLGAWIHGTPELASACKVAFDSGAPKFDLGMDVIENVTFWPVMQFGVAVRLF